MKIEEVKRIAIGVLKTKGEHLPQFIFFKGNQATAMTTPWSNDDEKEITKMAMRQYVKENKPDYFYHICEAWILESKLGNGVPKERPSQSPNRKSILLIERHDKTIKSEAIFIKFDKDKNGKVILGDEIVLDGKSGSEHSSGFNFYLEAEGHKERMDKIMKGGQ